MVMGRGGDTFRAAPVYLIDFFLPFLVWSPPRAAEVRAARITLTPKINYTGLNSSERINSTSLWKNSAEIVSCPVGSGCASCLVNMFLRNAGD